MSGGLAPTPGRLPFGWAFNWLGKKVLKTWNDYTDRKMHEAGEAIVRRAKQLAPVDTGALRDSIDYLVMYNEFGGKHELLIQVGEPYGIFQEFGTRNIPPHPYIRPALNEFGRVWGADVHMDFQAPGAVDWHGLLAGVGQHGAGFAASASPRWKPLTPKQVKHVEGTLIPSIKRHNRGNTKRARLRVRVI